jgi:hypothetical protein
MDDDYTEPVVRRLPYGVRPETDLTEGLARTDSTEDLPPAAPESGGKYGDLFLDPSTGEPMVLP